MATVLSYEEPMPPELGYDTIATGQQAITNLLDAQEPAFMTIGNRMFLSFATILLAWYGIRMIFGSRHSGDPAKAAACAGKKASSVLYAA
jgi:hypothetical protein